MPKYWIEKPIIYLHDNKVVRYRYAPEAPVELDDDVAAELGDAVRPVSAPEKPKVENPKPDAKPANRAEKDVTPPVNVPLVTPLPDGKE